MTVMIAIQQITVVIVNKDFMIMRMLQFALIAIINVRNVIKTVLPIVWSVITVQLIDLCKKREKISVIRGLVQNIMHIWILYIL